MKVLLASQFFVEGTDRLDFRLARDLKREGVETVMLVPSSAHVTRNVDGLKVYCVKPTPIVRSISGRFLKGSYILDMFRESICIVKKENVDLLHAFFAIPPGLALALCKKIVGRPLILNVTGADVGIVREITYGFRLDPVANKLVNLVLKMSDQTIVPSYRFKMLAILAGADSERIKVIPWSVDLENFQFAEKEISDLSASAEQKGVPKDKTILAMCRHTRVKGLDYLLHAMPRILREYPSAKLVLAGLGKQTEKLRDLARSLKIDQKVIFPGYIGGQEKLELFRTADVFVQPSLSDAFPISALEAMASGKPIVITDRVGLADFLKNGECGFIVKPRNAEMIEDALLKLLSDDSLQLRLGRKAREKSEEFSSDKITKRIVQVYHETLTQRPK